jgi:hypothetical protein
VARRGLADAVGRLRQRLACDGCKPHCLSLSTRNAGTPSACPPTTPSSCARSRCWRGWRCRSGSRAVLHVHAHLLQLCSWTCVARPTPTTRPSLLCLIHVFCLHPRTLHPQARPLEVRVAHLLQPGSFPLPGRPQLQAAGQGLPLHGQAPAHRPSARAARVLRGPHPKGAAARNRFRTQSTPAMHSQPRHSSFFYGTHPAEPTTAIHYVYTCSCKHRCMQAQRVADGRPVRCGCASRGRS